MKSIIKPLIILFGFVFSTCEHTIAQTDSASFRGSHRSNIQDSLDLAAQQFLVALDTAQYIEAQSKLFKQLIKSKHLEEAHELLDSSVEIFLKHLSRLETSKLYRKLAVAYWSTEGLDKPLILYKKGVELLSECKDKESLKKLAEYWAVIGRLEKSLRHFDDFENSFDQSLALYASLPVEEVAKDIYRTSRIYAIYLRSRGKQKQAYSVLKKAEKVVLDHVEDNAQMLVEIYTELGTGYNFSFGIEKSTDYYLKAKAILDSLPDNRSKIGNYYTLAFNMASAQDYENAALYAIKGIEMSKRLIGPKSSWVISGIYTLCIAYLESGKVDLAEKEALGAYLMCKETGVLSTQTGTQVMNILGKVYERKHNYKLAIEYLLQAEQVLSKMGITARENLFSSIGNTLGINLLKANRIDESLERFQNSLISNANNFDDQNVLVTPAKGAYKSLDWAFSTLKGKSLALERKYDQTQDVKFLLAAFSTVKAADQLITSIKQLSSSMNDQLATRPEFVTLLRTGIRVCHKLYKETHNSTHLSEAFHFVESAKSNLILTNLQESIALKMSNIPEDVLRANDDALQNITYFEQKLFRSIEANDSVSINEVSQLLSGLRLKADSIKQYINQLDPNFFDVKFSNEFATIESVQQSLKQDEIVLNYAIGDSCLFIFELTANEASLHRKSLNSSIRNLADQFVNEIHRPSFDIESAKNYLSLSDSIRERLLPKSASLDKARKITIIPDDFVSLIPFEATVASTKEPLKGYSSFNYLIDQQVIVYANSATLLARHKQGHDQMNQTRVLAFAPVFDQYSIDTLFKTDFERAGLSPLTWTNYEVQEISKHFETTKLLATNASESNFRNAAGRYPIIHIASHGLLNEEDTRYSKLVFYPSKLDSVNDGFLNILELYALKVPAELVVLSACNTAVGNIISGEGIVSLANAFFYAGSKSLVMSLWTANDQSTASIISEFYKGLAKGQTKSTALRNAKRQYLLDADYIRSHPYYWAHLVVNGSDRPITRTSNYLIYLLIFVAVGAAALGAAEKRRG